jgi:YidC/Oxa1 family membrane protein insertase
LAAGQVQAPAAIPAVTAAAETETTIENEKYRIVFTNRGAQVKHWILKGYNDTAGKPLDMVQPQAAAHFGFPLSLFTYEPALNTQLSQALYQVSASGVQPRPQAMRWRLKPTPSPSTTPPTAWMW